MIKIDYFYWCRYVIFELMKELCNKHSSLAKWRVQCKIEHLVFKLKLVLK